MQNRNLISRKEFVAMRSVVISLTFMGISKKPDR